MSDREPFPFTATKLQLSVIHKAEELALEKIEELLKIAENAREAVVALPFQNEEGEGVQHGSNRACNNVMKYFYNAAQALSWLSEREAGDELFERYGFRRGGDPYRRPRLGEWSYVHKRGFVAEDFEKGKT